MITKKLLLMGSMAVMGVAFISCSNESLFDDAAYHKQKDEAYTSNFEKRYGKIDPNQTWDFTTDTPTYSAVSGNTTRAAASLETADFTCQLGHMNIQPEISQYIIDNLPKGQNNSSKGRKFEMVIGENDFTVVPLFQGCASYYWELWMTIEGVGEYKIWSKGEGLKYRKAGTNDNAMFKLMAGKLDKAKTAKELEIGEITLSDILKELEKPARDPREDMPKPVLRSDILEMKDLKPGMILKGTVRNVIDFGVFVDIGVHQDGLVHVSQMSDKYIKHPLEAVSVGDVVDVRVLGVDLKKNRISLSMKGIK